jgi:hypothetical protein
LEFIAVCKSLGAGGAGGAPPTPEDCDKFGKALCEYDVGTGGTGGTGGTAGTGGTPGDGRSRGDLDRFDVRTGLAEVRDDQRDEDGDERVAEGERLAATRKLCAVSSLVGLDPAC